MLWLYLMFMRDAARLVALGTVAVFALILALGKLTGAEPGLATLLMWPLMFVGFALLQRRYLPRNLGWVLGLAHKKTSLVWFNLALNFTLLVLIGLAMLACSRAILAAFPNDWFLRSIARNAWSQPGAFGAGVLALMGSFLATMCFSLSRPPTASEWTRRAGRSAGIVAVLFFILLLSGLRTARGISPLMFFGAISVATTTSAMWTTARTLGTSIRQRWRWALVGAAFPLAAFIGVYVMAQHDLDAPDLARRSSALRALGQPDPTYPRASYR